MRNLLALAVESLEPNFQQLLKNIETAESVDDLIQFHDLYLYKCLSETLLLFDMGTGSASGAGAAGERGAGDDGAASPGGTVVS